MYVVGSSSVSSIGMGAAMTATSIAAGISQIHESQYLNKSFSPMKMALVPNEVLVPIEEPILEAFPALSSRQKKLLQLCAASLSDDFLALIPEGPVSVFLAGPEELFGTAVSGLGQDFLTGLIMQTGLEIDLASSRTFSIGRSGVLHAIDHAIRYMQASGAVNVVVGGVDSYCDHTLLGILDAQDRILADGVVDGFAPGEASGFLLLSSQQQKQASDNRNVRLSIPGLGQEPGSIYGSEPYKGDGLSGAITQAISNGPGAPIKKIYASMNGESFWAKELAVSMTRNHRAFIENLEVVHPADCFGDIGAAFGAVMLGVLSRNDPGVYLVYGASDSSYRGAVCAEVI